jgi:hypothetical protein
MMDHPKLPIECQALECKITQKFQFLIQHLWQSNFVIEPMENYTFSITRKYESAMETKKANQN